MNNQVEVAVYQNNDSRRAVYPSIVNIYAGYDELARIVESDAYTSRNLGDALYFKTRSDLHLAVAVKPEELAGFLQALSEEAGLAYAQDNLQSALAEENKIAGAMAASGFKGFSRS